jgi:predicted Zn-dependent peptidase
MVNKNYERFNEKVHIIKLKNGMQVHIMPKSEPYYSTYVEVSMPYGALNLNYTFNEQIFESPQGSAHFLEHKIFAMPDGDAFKKFSMLGVDANAMTAYQQTSYLFQATHHVIEALSHLFDMLDTPFFTEENVNQEKLIIAEEIKMYLDDPHSEMQNKLLENLYHHHPIQFDIGGTIESIETITPQVLTELYKAFYNPSNRLVVIAGKVDLKTLKTFFKNYDLEHPTKYPKPKTIYPKEPKKVKVKQEIIKKDIGMDRMMLGFKLIPNRFGKKEQVKHELSMTMLLNMLLGASSETYANLLQSGLINHSFYVQTYFEKLAESIIIYAESKKIKTLKTMLVQLMTQDAQALINQKAFIRYKKTYLGQFVFALNNIESKAYLYGKYFHMGLSLFDVVDIVKDIEFADIEFALSRIKKRYLATVIFKKA